jgi:hypothetical protein
MSNPPSASAAMLIEHWIAAGSALSAWIATAFSALLLDGRYCLDGTLRRLLISISLCGWKHWVPIRILAGHGRSI